MKPFRLLISCRRCRNKILYLAGPWPGWCTFTRRARKRVRLLPVHHEAHKADRSADSAKPRIYRVPGYGGRPS